MNRDSGPWKIPHNPPCDTHTADIPIKYTTGRKINSALRAFTLFANLLHVKPKVQNNF